MTLPATAPTMISISATEIAAQIDIRDAARARPIHSADASQTLSMAILFSALPQHAAPYPPRAREGGLGYGPRSSDSLAEKRFASGDDRPTALDYTVGVISLIGGFGGLHPRSRAVI